MGYVYLLWQKGSSLYKFGKTENLNTLLPNRKTYNPMELVKLGIIETHDYSNVEKRLMAKWKDYRFNGEWFDISPDKVPELLYDFNALPESILDLLGNAFNLGMYRLSEIISQGKFDGFYCAFKNIRDGSKLTDHCVGSFQERNHQLQEAVDKGKVYEQS